jgi:hypothetical protein
MMETPILKEQCTLLEIREWIEATAQYPTFQLDYAPRIAADMTVLIRETGAETVNGGMEWTEPHVAVFLFLMQSASQRHGWDEDVMLAVLMPMLSTLPPELQAVVHVDLIAGAFKIDDRVQVIDAQEPKP